MLLLVVVLGLLLLMLMGSFGVCARKCYLLTLAVLLRPR
jgi:hypothetical protein